MINCNVVIIISNKFFKFIKKSDPLTKHLNENNIYHYLFKCDLVEYNFKDIYKTFNISYFSKSNDLVENQFFDLNNLKDYESIEKVNKSFVSLLIKKFKFRISFMETNNFSKDIIISDDYNFDPAILNHEEDIIKIAVIKNDYEKWIIQDLSKYDYIFTFNEYFEDVNRNYKCFNINGETIYEIIKNILNELYKRKLDKFLFFIKNINFQDVFPKLKDYFKILNSKYFDDQWYRDKYNLSDNTDSVIHFLLIGSSKDNDPGPNFSTHEYYECNLDVKVSGVNPLVHYETYGKKENRIIKVSDIPKRDYSLISNSPYFDKEWYKSTYEIEDEDLVNHYLKVGYAKWYNPGPDFDNFEYYETNFDVRKTHINPLLHYELYGRREKRNIKLPQDKYEWHRSSIVDSPYFDEDWYKSTYNLDDDVNPVDHYWKIGFAKGYNPGPDFSTLDYFEANKDVEEHGLNPLVHYEIYGRNEGRKLKLDEN